MVSVAVLSFRPLRCIQMPSTSWPTSPACFLAQLPTLSAPNASSSQKMLWPRAPTRAGAKTTESSRGASTGISRWKPYVGASWAMVTLTVFGIACSPAVAHIAIGRKPQSLGVPWCRACLSEERSPIFSQPTPWAWSAHRRLRHGLRLATTPGAAQWRPPAGALPWRTGPIRRHGRPLPGLWSGALRVPP